MEQEILNYNIGIRRDFDSLYSYSYREKLDNGQLVIVNFRNRDDIGIVVNSDPPSFSGKIKNIVSVLPYAIPEKYLKFAKFVSEYNITAFGNILKLLVPFSISQILNPERKLKKLDISLSAAELNSAQKEALEKLLKHQADFKVTLFQGITGSGKTEVFLEFAKSILSLNKQILIMVPEIALSTELSKKVASRLGVDCYIWHNSVSPTRKLAIWKKALNGEQICIVGARSALYIPFGNLGAIIIDEEHDNSYKQTESVLYNARDMAIYLGSCLNIPIILSSATPSVETYNNAISGKYEYVKLTTRYYEKAKLPEIVIDDIRDRENIGVLSHYSMHAIKRCLASGKQALVFVNRRGHTPRVLCRFCGWKFSCPACSSWLCYHAETNNFLCHYCGHIANVRTTCGRCGKGDLIGDGAGVEKVAIECDRILPNARILPLSSDNMNTPKKIAKNLEMIKNNEVNLIIGTQIVSKGHNFDNLDLVVITCVDSMLYGDDFRSLEKAFQTIYQVSGRAGRKDGSSSKVIIQTYNAGEKLLQFIAKNDVDSIYEMELKNRRFMGMPPFGKITAIIVSGFDRDEAYAVCKNIILNAPANNEVKIYGPLVPSISKLRSRYRFRIHVLSKTNIQNYIKFWIDSIEVPKGISIIVNVDPYDFS